MRPSNADAGVWLRLSQQHARNGRYPEAEAAVLEAVRLAPEDPRVMHWRAVTLMDTRPGRALALMRRAAEHPDADAYVLTRVADALREAGEQQEAQAALDRVANSADESHEVLYVVVRGRLAADRGDDLEAERLFRIAVEADPGYVPAVQALAEYLADQGQHQQAVDVIDIARSQGASGDALLELRARLLDQYLS